MKNAGQVGLIPTGAFTKAGGEWTQCIAKLLNVEPKRIVKQREWICEQLNVCICSFLVFFTLTETFQL